MAKSQVLSAFTANAIVIAPRTVVTDPDLNDPATAAMCRFCEGDDDAFDDLVALCNSYVRSLLYLRTGNDQNLDDLSQEVFLRVFKARATYRPTAKFTVWLFYIIRSVASSANLSVGRAAHRLNDLREQGMIRWQQTRTPHDEVCLVELINLANSAILGLCERQRGSLEMFMGASSNYKLLAERLGVSISAAKSILARARMNVRKELAPYLRDGHREAPNANEMAVDMAT